MNGKEYTEIEGCCISEGWVKIPFLSTRI
ncbi:MAG: DUF3297 family protein [Gammaproteobacteria bacterium]|nr:DUF3297 family protein [Gammaproteobacteria bacterium]